MKPEQTSGAILHLCIDEQFHPCMFLPQAVTLLTRTSAVNLLQEKVLTKTQITPDFYLNGAGTDYKQTLTQI